MTAMGERLPGLRRAVWVISAALVLVGATAGEAAADGSITGTITKAAGGPAANACVSASSATAVELEATTADAGGNYSIAGLGAADDYTVRFSACGTANLVSEYYDDKSDIDSADLVTVVDGVPTAGISAELATGGSITGTVTGPGGAPLDDVCVQANGPTDTGSAETDAGGDYTIDSLPTGDYEVHFESCIAGALLSEYYDDKPTAATADLVAVTAGTPTPNIDAELALGGTISGTATGPGGAPLEDLCVSAADAGFDNAGSAVTDAAGDYTIAGLHAASYKVKFFSCGVGNWATEFYDDKPTRASADALPG